ARAGAMTHLVGNASRRAEPVVSGASARRPSAMDGRVPVVLIAGTGRSGSTLVGGVLGNVPGCFYAGEVRFIWDRGLEENRLCGCGVRFRECPVWRSILDDAFGGVDRALVDGRAGHRIGGRVRDVPRM